MNIDVVIFLSSLFWSYAFSETCVTPLGANSTCMAIYDCKPLMNAFEQRSLNNSVNNFLKQSQCDFSGPVPRVCCGPLPPQQEQPPTTQRSTTTSLPTNDNGVTDAVFDEDSLPAPRNQCGIETNSDRLYEGQTAELDEFPWLALIKYRTSTGDTNYECGGVLVNRRYVLTAAHCITGALLNDVGTPTMVRLGEYDMRTKVDCIDKVCADPTQNIPILSTHPHPEYTDKNNNRRNDVGLIRLSRRATYSSYVQPTCLVDKNERLSTGTDVYVAGWGRTLNGQNSPVKLIRGLPIYDKLQCADMYRNLKVDLTNGQLCAGGIFSPGPCRGDPGGPLMKRTFGGKWEVVGVVSFGFVCRRDDWPGVYTSVAKYTDWIHSTMRSSNV